MTLKEVEQLATQSDGRYAKRKYADLDKDERTMRKRKKTTTTSSHKKVIPYVNMNTGYKLRDSLSATIGIQCIARIKGYRYCQY
jgi:hypothetical protein